MSHESAPSIDQATNNEGIGQQITDAYIEHQGGEDLGVYNRVTKLGRDELIGAVWQPEAQYTKLKRTSPDTYDVAEVTLRAEPGTPILRGSVQQVRKATDVGGSEPGYEVKRADLSSEQDFHLKFKDPERAKRAAEIMGNRAVRAIIKDKEYQDSQWGQTPRL